MTEKTKKEKKVIVIPAREDRNSENGQEKNKRRVAAYKGGQQGKDRAEGEKGAGCEDDGETGGKAEAAHKEPRKGKAQDEPEGDRAGWSG